MAAAPGFWDERPGLAARLLLPAGAAWDIAGRVRRALARPYCAPVPVICVGNLVVGGAGKTPVTLALADWLVARGVAAHSVTRGYGGRIAGPLRVDPLRHSAVEVGDEALLLARRAPCWVARDRAAGVVAATAAGAQVVLLDDGFQNPAVAKTLALLVVDAGYGFGNGRVMPAGPLRENLTRGLARADALVVLADQGGPRQGLTGLSAGRTPIVPAELWAVAGERFSGRRVVAFAGIGRPEKFFATLRRLGAELVAEQPFPDHYPFRERDVAALCGAAWRERAHLVTTAKDFVRLPLTLRAEVEVLEVEIRWPDAAGLTRLLDPVVLSYGGDGRVTERYAD